AYALVEVDVVYAFHRSLDAALRDHAGSVDDAIVGHDEVREIPLEVLEAEPARPRYCEQTPQGEQDRSRSAVVHQGDQNTHGEERDPGRDVLREEPPVRAEVERDLLAVVQQLLGVRHAEILCAPGPAKAGPVAI